MKRMFGFEIFRESMRDNNQQTVAPLSLLLSCFIISLIGGLQNF